MNDDIDTEALLAAIALDSRSRGYSARDTIIDAASVIQTAFDVADAYDQRIAELYPVASRKH
jgi:hypothetical protein